MYLVRKIIEKCEYHSEKDWKPGSCGGRTMKIQQKDYSTCGKQELMQEIQILQAQHLITVTKWVVYGSDVGEIGYRLENLPDFYEIERQRTKSNSEGFQSKAELVERCYKQVADELTHGVNQNWIWEYYQSLLDKLEKIGKGKILNDFDKMELYVKCFRGLDEIVEPMYKRVFSKKYLGNSKIFEDKKIGLESQIIAVAKAFCEDVEPDMDDTAVLSQIYIKEYSQEMALKGPLKLNIFMNGKSYAADISTFVYGAVFNSETLQHADIDTSHMQIKKVVTVENKANFVSMPYAADTLYVFSHGYFSPLEKKFLQKLERELEKGNSIKNPEEQVQYFHTGDLDYGGVKIFEYIKKIFSPNFVR